MIEVEKKFLLDGAERERLLEGAKFVSEYSFTDTYFDDKNYSLTSKDIWLRKRDGKWELKIPLHKGADRLGDQYRELDTEEEIRGLINIEAYSPFSTFMTIRKKYQKGDFIIDLDFVDFGDFKYEIGEIELIVEDESKSAEALDKILNFAKENGLKITHVRGKLMEYLKRMRPDHFQKLVAANVANAA